MEKKDGKKKENKRNCVLYIAHEHIKVMIAFLKLLSKNSA